MPDGITFYRLDRKDVELLEDERWLATVGITEDGEIFAPWVCHPSRSMPRAMAAAWSAGVAFAIRDNQIYLPTRWLRRELDLAIEAVKGRQRALLEASLASLSEMETAARNLILAPSLH